MMNGLYVTQKALPYTFNIALERKSEDAAERTTYELEIGEHFVSS